VGIKEFGKAASFEGGRTEEREKKIFKLKIPQNGENHTRQHEQSVQGRTSKK